jgi:prenyltransferase beta subunit
MFRQLLAFFLIFHCAATARAQTLEEKKRTFGYLDRLQTESGGFLPVEKGNGPSLRATTTALRAYRYFGGEVPRMGKVAEYVKGCFDKSSGGFTDRPGEGKPDVFLTASGLMAVAEMKLPFEDYLAAVQYLEKNIKNFDELRLAAAAMETIRKDMPHNKTLKLLIQEMRDSLGLLREKKGGARALARMTGSMAVTMMRLGEKMPDESAMRAVIQDGQMRDGGFAKENTEKSDLETTYRVTRALVMLKLRPKQVEAMRSFVAKCRNEDGGYGLQPGTPSSASATYFATIVLHWLNK